MMKKNIGQFLRSPFKAVIWIASLFCLIFNTVPGFAEEKVTLEMWSHWGGETMKMRFIEETIQAFETAHPHIKIKLHWTPKNRLNQSLQVSLPKGQGPDIFYTEPYPLQEQPWVMQGYLLDLRDKLDWSRFEPSGYKLYWEYPDGGIYAVPIEIGEYAIYYNQELVANAGIALPTSGKFTTDEFLDVVKTFRSKGIIPIAIGNQDRGTASVILFQELLIRFAGTEKITKKLTNLDFWTDPDVVATFTYMKQLIDAGVFPEEMNRLKYEEGRELFIQGKSAMYVEGTWFFGKVADENGNLPPQLEGNLGAMDFPILIGGKGNYTIERMTGGSYAIRKSGPHTKEAVEFLDFMTSQENGLNWIQYTQSPFGVKVGFAEHVSLPFLQELFKSRGDVKEVIVPGPASLLTEEEYKVWVRDVGIAFMGGGLSVEEVVQRLAQAVHVKP